MMVDEHFKNIRESEEEARLDDRDVSLSHEHAHLGSLRKCLWIIL